MKYIIPTAISLFLIGGSAFAAEPTKAELAAQFRMKVVMCTAQAKTDGVKRATVEFYSYMATCLPKAQVTIAWVIEHEAAVK